MNLSNVCHIGVRNDFFLAYKKERKEAFWARFSLFLAEKGKKKLTCFHQ
jgi:hypothetical protein